MARAKTGTGKTMAFLIPAIEGLVRSPPRAGNISVLVLSPTRELASQVGVAGGWVGAVVDGWCGRMQWCSSTRELAPQTSGLRARPGRCYCWDKADTRCSGAMQPAARPHTYNSKHVFFH